MLNTAEGGTDATTVTTGNSGGNSGDAFDLVDITGGSTVTFDNDHPAHGGMAIKVDGAAGGVGYVRWATTATESWGGAYCYTDDVTNNRIVQIGGPGGTNRAYVEISAGDKLKVYNRTGAGTAEGAVVISNSIPFRIDWHFIAHATTGLIEAKLFLAPDSTIATETVTLANTDTGSDVDKVNYGHFNGTNDPALWLDDLQLSTTGWTGPTITSQYADAVLTDDPTFWFRFIEAASAIPHDSSGNNLHWNAAPAGATYQVASPLTREVGDYAMRFNEGSSFIVDDPLLDLGTDVFTLEVWVKRERTAIREYFFNKGGDGYVFCIEADDVLTLGKLASPNIVKATVSSVDTNWHHYVATKNGATSKLYIDGVDVTGTVTNQTIVGTNESLNFFRSNIADDALLGSADEAAGYATALSPARVLAHYEAGIADKQAYYAYRRRSNR